ncbi:MAG: abortive infection family protein [Verrucomicrobiia bacterium]|jgi:hypothetical protein
MKTRHIFREYMVNCWTLRQISDEFDAAKVPCRLKYEPHDTGQKRSLVEQYYHGVKWSDWRDVKKVLKVYEGVLRSVLELEELAGRTTYGSNQADAARMTFKRMIDTLSRDGLQWIDGRIMTGAGMPLLDGIKEAAAEFDAKHLADQIRRMEQSIESDPALAIGTAKELVETCCKTILAVRGKPVTGTPDIPTLTKETLKELKLVPDGIPESARGGDVIKRLLSNLGTIGNGLAELRGLYGTGHGKHGKTSGLSPRHAKLAVGAAVTLATFLFETHKETIE